MGVVLLAHVCEDLDIDALLDLASQPCGTPVDDANAMPMIPVREPGRLQATLAGGAPIPHEGGEGLGGKQSRHRRSGPAEGSMELPVQRRRTRKCQSKLVVPIEQVDGSSSDDNETSRNNNGSDSLKAVREYNRRAQQKCRNRQKQKLAMSEGRAQELQRALERLKLEKVALEAKNQVLQQLVEGSRQPQQPADTNSAADQGAVQEEREGAISAGAMTLHMAAPAHQIIHLSLRGGRSGLRSTAGPFALSMEQLVSMPVGELAALYTDYVEAMAELVQEARGDASCPAGMRAVQLTGELRLLVSSLMAVKRWSLLRALKMDPGGGEPSMESPPPDWWRKVYLTMGLTDGQRRSAVMYRNHLLLRMRETLRARRDIYLNLLRRREGVNPDLFVQDPQGGIQLAQGLLVVSEAAEELRQNIAEEQQLHNQFLVAVRAMLTPLQSATAIVHSYPWCPEPLTIINCAADEEGAPPAHELLACPAPGGPAWPPNVLPPPIMDAAGVSCGPT